MVRNAQLPSRSASLVNPMLPHAGDHTGSRAIEWLTEVDRRTHTCLMAGAAMLQSEGGFQSCLHNGKVKSQPTVLFKRTPWTA